MATDVRVYDGTQWVSLQGPRGATGATGAAGTVTVGTVTTGAPGTSVSVTDSNPSPSDATLNFTIPRGDPGQAATVSVGSVTSLPPGSTPTVVNAGTSSAAVLNFGLVKGEKGDSGSGVTIKGTLSGAGTALPTAPASGDMYILGSPVPTAAPNPATGSKAEGDGITWTGTAWTNVGPIRGPAGPAGAAGTSASVTVGTTTGLAPGASPTVTNTGTSSAAIINFGIPAGATGAAGENAQVFTSVGTPAGARVGAIWLVP